MGTTINDMIEQLEYLRDALQAEAGLSREDAGNVEVRCAHQQRNTLNGAIVASAALKLDGVWIAMLGMGDEQYGGRDVWDRSGEVVDADAEQEARDAEIRAELEQ